jgi:hypothetical protein
VKAQNKLNSFLADLRTQQVVHQDYQVKLAVARNRWNKRRIQFEQSKLNMLLPSRHGTYSAGTNYIQRYAARPDHTGIAQHVSQCLADIVDVVDNAARGRIRLERFNEKFIPPPDPRGVDSTTGETMQQKQKRTEKELRQEIENLNQKLRSSEENRSNAWKKVLKTKAECGIMHDLSVGGGPSKLTKVDISTALTIPVPVLRQTTTQNIASSSQGPSNPTHGSYTPAARRAANPRRSTPSSSTPRSTMLTPHDAAKSPQDASESKYSAARVKERIAADGSVAPVSEPKKGKDGLYLRPAGRTRKGMEWDAVRGIWKPAEDE